MRVENNTVLRLRAHEKPDSEDVVFWEYWGHENIAFRNNIFVYDPAIVEPVFSRGKLPHDHNLYYRTDNPHPKDHVNKWAYHRFILGGGAWLGEGDIVGDPLFVDLGNRDLRLRPDSPAVDAGVDLGFSLDFDGNSIPSGAAPDVGACERPSPSD